MTNLQHVEKRLRMKTPERPGPVILDGRALAARRLPSIRAAADGVAALRGTPPLLLLVAFPSADGTVRHVPGKLRACAAAGVDAAPLVLDSADGTARAIAAMEEAIALRRPDAVFVQVPAPPDLDEAAILRAIPPAADVDIMTPACFRSYMSGASDLPPVTISAALELLNHHDISVDGLAGVVAAGESPFALMFAEALRRRGASVSLLPPAAPAWADALSAAELVVAAVGRSGVVPAARLRRGAVVLDIGYFNEDGRGDVDVGDGAAHLRALMPVPGGVGPMTVSHLVGRVVEYAAARLEAPDARDGRAG